MLKTLGLTQLMLGMYLLGMGFMYDEPLCTYFGVFGLFSGVVYLWVARRETQ